MKPYEVGHMDVDDRKYECILALEEQIIVMEQRVKETQNKASNMVADRLGSHPKIHMAHYIATTQHAQMDV